MQLLQNMQSEATPTVLVITPNTCNAAFIVVIVHWREIVIQALSTYGRFLTNLLYTQEPHMHSKIEMEPRCVENELDSGFFFLHPFGRSIIHNNK